MKRNYKTILFFCLISLSCMGAKILESNQQSSILNLMIKQGKTEILPIEDVENINLLADEFSLTFDLFPYGKDDGFYSLKVAATFNPDNLQYFVEGKIEDYKNPFLSPGTGMACEKNKEYPALYIKEDTGSHYIFYNKENYRAKLVKKLKNGKMRVKWDVNSINNEQEELEMTHLKGKLLYLFVFSDENLNETVDKGEYHLLNIQF